MTIETETILIKFLERIEAEAKETNRKLDKFIETTQKDLTDIKVNQVRLEGEVKTLDVKIDNLQKGQDKLESELKEVKTELKETRNDVSVLYKWFAATIITAGIGLATVLLKVFDFFPKA